MRVDDGLQDVALVPEHFGLVFRVEEGFVVHGDIFKHFRYVKAPRRVVGVVVGRRFAGRPSERPHLDRFWALEAVVIARAVVGVVIVRRPLTAARNVSVAGLERRREAAWAGGHGVHRLARLMRETTRSILSR